MSLWMLIALLALIKIPIAAMLLWIPLRSDAAMEAGESTGQSDDDGGSHVTLAGPLDPHPRRPLPRGPRSRSPRPRRGPHGCPPPPSPHRVRTAAPVSAPIAPRRRVRVAPR